MIEYKFIRKIVEDDRLIKEAGIDRTNFLGTKQTETETFLCFKEKLTPEEKLKLDIAFQNHIFNKYKPKLINQLFDEIGTYVQEGKVLTIKEYELIKLKYNLQ